MWKNHLNFFVLLFGINYVFTENNTCFELISNQQSIAEEFTTGQLQWICNSFNKKRLKKASDTSLIKISRIDMTTGLLKMDNKNQEKNNWEGTTWFKYKYDKIIHSKMSNFTKK